MNVRDFLSLAARMIVSGILLYAGFTKAVGPTAEFAAILEAYKLFPPAFLAPLATALPYIEMWIGLFLLAGLHLRAAALVSALLSLSFLLSVGSAIIRHIDLASCGCFGPNSLKPHQTMLLDVALLGLSLLIYRFSKYPPACSLDRSYP